MRKPLSLSTVDPAELTDRQVMVGYPGYDPSGDDEFQHIQNRIFRGTYYVKRLQPGVLRVRRAIESFRLQVEPVTHDSSTLGGNSGSAVFLLPRLPDEPLALIGLHFAGAYLVANYAVSAYDLGQDGRVVDAGVQFVGRPEPRGDRYAAYWRKADVGESPCTGPPGSPSGWRAASASAESGNAGQSRTLSENRATASSAGSTPSRAATPRTPAASTSR